MLQFFYKFSLVLKLHHLPPFYLVDACYDLKSEIADSKEYAVAVAAVVDWHSAVDVVIAPVSTTQTKTFRRCNSRHL